MIAAARAWYADECEDLDPVTGMEKGAFIAGMRAAGAPAEAIAAVQSLLDSRTPLRSETHSRYVNPSGDDD